MSYQQTGELTLRCPPVPEQAEIKRFSPEWVAQQRGEWHKEPLEADAIDCYRVNYNIPGWSRFHDSNYGMMFAACLAIERLCCEIERLREALERITDDADCTDLQECKHLAREATKL